MDDLIVLHIMDVFSKYSVITPVRSKNPLEVWDAFIAWWVGIFGPPRAIQMDEGGEWKNEVWTDFCTDRRIKLPFQGVGAHPWILERRHGLARGIYNRIRTDDRFSGRQIVTEVQWCLNTLISASGYSAYQLVFGSNPTDRYGWGDTDEDLLFVQDTSVSGQFVQQWELRMMAQEAAHKEIANSKLRRLLAHNQTFNCTDIKIGDSVLFYKAPHRKSHPRWRGPATILDIDETGVLVKYQSQFFKVARYCVP